MWIGEDLESMVGGITNQEMVSVRLKTHACWILEIAKLLLAFVAKGVE